jgi:hypothetical protein
VDFTGILAEIDNEIATLKQARALLSSEAVAKRGPGKPKGSVNVAAPKPAKKKRNLSPEGHKRIQEAVK